MCSPQQVTQACNATAEMLNYNTIMLRFLYITMHIKICVKNTDIDFAATLILGGVVIRQEVAAVVAEVQVAGGDQVVPAPLYLRS